VTTTLDAITALDPRNGLLINGRSLAAPSTFSVTDPATGGVLAEMANGTILHATDAVTAAAESLPDWAGTSPRRRADILRRAFDLMIDDTERLVALICAENGKSEADARAEVGYAAEFFRWFSEEAVRSDGAFGLSPAGQATTIVTHRPVGVAALVTPWNFPAAMATRKLAPALAAGCTVVLKPASETPLTALAIARLLAAAGVPDGVVNVVPTKDSRGVVSSWLSDPRVRALSFTGSTGVGKGLLAQAAARVVNTSMELGGNAPFVVAADADVEAAVTGAMVAKFRGGGQACTAANRFYVHTAVAEEFLARFGAATQALRVGPASDPSSEIGPLINAGAAGEVRRLITDAVADGARIAYQAHIPEPAGNYVAPTVLTDVRPDAKILQEEIFGPVAPVVVWDDEATLRRWLADSEYGLAAYVYSADLPAALRIAEATEAGMVGINRGIVSDPSAPFGGTKQSGLGREGAREGIHEFQETYYYSVDLPRR
jgi:succinate-semialdehyde dehydrogenase/glutarate-semialdehyde dehydrogenase